MARIALFLALLACSCLLALPALLCLRLHFCFCCALVLLAACCAVALSLRALCLHCTTRTFTQSHIAKQVLVSVLSLFPFTAFIRNTLQSTLFACLFVWRSCVCSFVRFVQRASTNSKRALAPLAQGKHRSVFRSVACLLSFARLLPCASCVFFLFSQVISRTVSA